MRVKDYKEGLLQDMDSDACFEKTLLLELDCKFNLTCLEWIDIYKTKLKAWIKENMDSTEDEMPYDWTTLDNKLWTIYNNTTEHYLKAFDYDSVYIHVFEDTYLADLCRTRLHDKVYYCERQIEDINFQQLKEEVEHELLTEEVVVPFKSPKNKARARL